MLAYLENLWGLFVDMSFYIVIGLVFTGLLHVFIKKDAILKHVGKDNTSSVVKASVVGVPLPLCSCGVVPTAMYLGKSGASKGAVVSFLTSTPQTGVDSIIATYGMMGPLFAVYRAVAAFLSGIISGIATNIICKKDKIKYSDAPTSCCCGHEAEKQVETSCCCEHEAEKQVEVSCCCGHEAEKQVEASCCCGHEAEKQVETSCCCGHEVEKQVEASCCCGHDTEQVREESFLAKIKRAMQYAFGEFLEEIAGHFAIGLLIAALIATLLPADILATFSNPLVSMLLMVVIGIPMYICSTASIPIAVSLMMKGISPGAAFVFLFAGPVTNIASLTIVMKTLGKKVTTIYLGSVAVCAIVFGLVLDYIIKITGYTGISQLMTHNHEHETPLYMLIIAVLFGALVLKCIFKKLSHKMHKVA